MDFNVKQMNVITMILVVENPNSRQYGTFYTIFKKYVLINKKYNTILIHFWSLQVKKLTCRNLPVQNDVFHSFSQFPQNQHRVNRLIISYFVLFKYRKKNVDD